MKLYQSQSSPNARRVRIAIAEMGLCIASVPVDLGAGEQRSAAYAAINSRLVVPTLVLDDGTAIGEVPAIVRYLDEAHPGHALIGTTPKARALTTMWERRMELEGLAAVMETVRNSAPRLADRAIAGPHDYAQIPALVERGWRRIADFLDDLDARLGRERHVAGETFTFADVTALVTVDFAAKALGVAIPDDHVHTRAWHAAASRCPSAAA